MSTNDKRFNYLKFVLIYIYLAFVFICIYQHMNVLTKGLTYFKETDKYNLWLYQQVKNYIKGDNILEIGSGLGTFSQFLKKYQRVTFSDIEKKYLNYLKKNFKKTSFRIIYLDIVNLPKNIEKESFDTIISINTFEHIKNDIKGMKNIYLLLKPKGRLVLRTQAMPILFGSIDVYQGHFRRYSKKDLAEKLKKTGFLIEKISYANFFAFFAWFWYSKVLKTRILPKEQLLLFDKLTPIIKRIERNFPLPFGQSIIAIARKGNK